MSIKRGIVSILWMVALWAVAIVPAAPVLAAHMDEAVAAKAQDDHAPEMVNVILQTAGRPSDSDLAVVRAFGGNPGQVFQSINGFAAQVPSPALKGLAKNPRFANMSLDAPVQSFWDKNTAGHPVGAFDARASYSVNGSGVGVAVIDSGINMHPDFKWGYNSGTDSAIKTFTDFVDLGNKSPIDPYGHGTHVSGIIAGRGSVVGQFSGISPAAQLHVLRVLNGSGSGSVSGVLAAMDWVRQNRGLHNLRVVNLSLGHPVRESYLSDPLTRAVESLVKQGIVVVCAAGNFGRTQDGTTVYGGITSPGNSPYAVTVGSMNPAGTPMKRSDDFISGFSSRGPTHIDNLTKPDMVAPGAFLVSVESTGSSLSTQYSDLIVQSSLYGAPPGEKDYFTLSGTSMAAPVVSGIAALMLQKNPSLTPNLVKGILQYTSENRGYDVMTQGAGYVNAVGALEAASMITTSPDQYGDGDYWLIQPLSGSSLINGESVTWNGYMVWGASVLWGNLLGSDYESLWGLSVYWGSVTPLNDGDLLVDGIQANAVMWDFNSTCLTNVCAYSVLWVQYGSALTDLDIIYGQDYHWGGKK
jgi:serine protease AprX